jgi:hypothetical protein
LKAHRSVAVSTASAADDIPCLAALSLPFPLVESAAPSIGDAGGACLRTFGTDVGRAAGTMLCAGLGSAPTAGALTACAMGDAVGLLADIVLLDAGAAAVGC